MEVKQLKIIVIQKVKSGCRYTRGRAMVIKLGVRGRRDSNIFLKLIRHMIINM